MKGCFIIIIILLASTCAAACFLCPPLRQRSIARGQPFALPIEHGVASAAELESLVAWLGDAGCALRAAISRDGRWLEVRGRHTCNHAQLMRAFRCE